MEWSGCAAFKERDNAGRGGWIVDERFQNSCVGGCEFSDCRVQLSVSFWARQAGPKRDRLAGLLLFPFRKVYWKHNGNKSVEGFAGPTGGPSFGTAFGASVHQPLYPCQSAFPPRPLHTLYQIGIDRCASPARACGRPPSSPHSPFPHLPPTSAHLLPPVPHQPPTRTAPHACSPSCSYATISSYARILALHPSQEYFPVTPYLTAVA